MATITIDGQQVECRDGISALQAALEAGLDIPHYCYHPGLKVVASCRLCLMEMQLPHPKTGEMGWAPKMQPSCQTPVRDGMIIRFESDRVRENIRATMEAYLLNHPLDCPLCDQAGECYLQDYSMRFGRASSRFVDAKTVMPKKEMGPRTLLYADRCVLCSRCVRFTEEISGTAELCVVSRGARSEIDAFPGLPLDNPLQGNVVDICPVGALLDKDFLFTEPVWNLKSTPSICPGCSTGCAINVDTSDGRVKRLKPRFNPGVNDWWICDDGRFGYAYVHDQRRLTQPLTRRGQDASSPQWEEIPSLVRVRLENEASEHGSEKIAAVVSPMMSCEEAWLVVQFVRQVAPESVLVMGHVPSEGEERRFPVGFTNGQAKFVIQAERCPNRRGVELILANAGGTVIDFAAFVERAGSGDFAAAWISGGYPGEWITKEWAKAMAKIPLIVAHDLFPSALTEAAAVILPACPFVEREGSFMNHAGRLQTFRRALTPLSGCRQDGQFLAELAGHEGLYNGRQIRELMAAGMAEFSEICDPPPKPAHQH